MDVYQSRLFGLDVLVMDGMAEHRRLEPWAIHLLNHVSALLRQAVGDISPEFMDLAENGPIPEGPYFVYDQAPGIFSGRVGRGPLKIAWDTSLLLDYFKYGLDLWQGESPSGIDDEKYTSELECLQLIVGLWTIRDIRFKILPATIVDAKRNIPSHRRRARINAFDEFTHAIELVNTDEEDSPAHGLIALPESALEGALRSVPGGWDRILVRQTVEAGEHVFLTRDTKILRCQRQLRPFGLRPATPGDLLETLLACGAFNCLLLPRCAYWPLMDTQRTAHLIRALEHGTAQIPPG